MTFGHDHYVPVLKVKRGEKMALQMIAAPLQVRMTPLLEIVKRNPQNSPTVERHLNTAFANLVSAVRPYSRFFLDVREIENDGRRVSESVFRRAADEGMTFTPVTGISRTVDVTAALHYNANGIAIRLTRREFETGQIPRGLPAFLATHRLEPEQIDLIVDLGAVDEMIPVGIKALTNGFLGVVPNHVAWRTLTVSGCAFPPSMGGLERSSHDLVERAEWVAWRDGLHTRRSQIPRLPTFSDCAIQHPKGVEDFDFRTMQVSASIRYTLAERWLRIKGVSTRVEKAKVQFPLLATNLVYGHLKSHYSGASHCVGCQGAKAAADGAPKFGSPEAWRRLGTIHHLTLAVEGLSALL